MPACSALVRFVAPPLPAPAADGVGSGLDSGVASGVGPGVGDQLTVTTSFVTVDVSYTVVLASGAEVKVLVTVFVLVEVSV